VRRLAPGAGLVAITLALTYPLASRIGSTIPHDAGDPILNTWLLWWSTQAWPLTPEWWNAPMFHPMRDAMALSELLIGLLPITAPTQWLTGSPLVAYNVAFLLSFPLCGLATYALAFELTGRRDAAWIAALAFAFGPYRMNQLSHVQVLSYYWAPLAILALHRYVRTGRPTWLAVFAGAWLMQTLVNGYALFHVSVLIALWLAWWARTRRVAFAIIAAWAIGAALLVPILLKYRSVHERLNLARDINEVKRFSADISSFFSAPSELALWGSRLGASHVETALFPGLTVAVVGAAAWVLTRRMGPADRRRWPAWRKLSALAALIAAVVACSALVVGPWAIGRLLTVTDVHKPLSLALIALIATAAGSCRWKRAWRERSPLAFYGAAMAAMYVLSFGPSPTFFGRAVFYEAPYAWLMRVPGFDALRVPARFAMLALLCQSICLALVFARWAPRSMRLRAAVAVALSVGILADGWVRLTLEAAPRAGPTGWSGVTAVLEAPPGGPGVDFPALYRAMHDGRRLVNGWSGYYPPHYAPLLYSFGRDPAQAADAIAALASAGSIGVAMDRRNLGNRDLEQAVAALPSAKAMATDGEWATFTVHPAGGGVPASSGALVRVVRVDVNRKPEDADRLVDGRLETAWGPGTAQDGAEEVVVDIGEGRHVGAVVLAMGSYAFGFPRELAIDVSNDGSQWRTAWRGQTAVPVLRAALAEPERVPLTLTFAPTPTRFVRLRQLGADSGVPWWIAELELRER
jgi:hypothetical protein